jgi:hypothetical protein
MRPMQRRTLALCVFALTFNLYYEARGSRLFNAWGESAPQRPPMELFTEQAVTGTMILALGVVLLAVLRRQGENAEFSGAELGCYCLGLGILVGTLIVSWTHVSG